MALHGNNILFQHNVAPYGLPCYFPPFFTDTNIHFRTDFRSLNARMIGSECFGHASKNTHP
ncbi:hypothetical protein SAMN05216404_101339 [Nitrosospira multiformis]|uniref:Uncharacterized protein n=1 Tax=Nitrosospira multiformis TaxID=1231 RepID=A0A1H8BUT5_9PROT|nr:hypothetical protein SAMN05216404_101339 [Nitrosospira multiformis]